MTDLLEEGVRLYTSYGAGGVEFTGTLGEEDEDEAEAESSDFLESAVSWLDGVRSVSMAQSVVYHRGAESVSLSATMGGATFEVADEYGVAVRTRGVDFIVSVADLVLGSVRVTPQSGDRIRFVRGTDTLVYEVLDLAGGGHYQQAEGFDTVLRIHAKRVATE